MRTLEERNKEKAEKQASKAENDTMGVPVMRAANTIGIEDQVTVKRRKIENKPVNDVSISKDSGSLTISHKKTTVSNKSPSTLAKDKFCGIKKRKQFVVVKDERKPIESVKSNIKNFTSSIKDANVRIASINNTKEKSEKKSSSYTPKNINKKKFTKNKQLKNLKTTVKKFQKRPISNNNIISGKVRPKARVHQDKVSTKRIRTSHQEYKIVKPRQQASSSADIPNDNEKKGVEEWDKISISGKIRPQKKSDNLDKKFNKDSEQKPNIINIDNKYNINTENYNIKDTEYIKYEKPFKTNIAKREDISDITTSIMDPESNKVTILKTIRDGIKQNRDEYITLFQNPIFNFEGRIKILVLFNIQIDEASYLYQVRKSDLDKFTISGFKYVYFGYKDGLISDKMFLLALEKYVKLTKDRDLLFVRPVIDYIKRERNNKNNKNEELNNIDIKYINFYSLFPDHLVEMKILRTIFISVYKKMIKNTEHKDINIRNCDWENEINYNFNKTIEIKTFLKKLIQSKYFNIIERCKIDKYEVCLVDSDEKNENYDFIYFILKNLNVSMRNSRIISRFYNEEFFNKNENIILETQEQLNNILKKGAEN